MDDEQQDEDAGGDDGDGDEDGDEDAGGDDGDGDEDGDDDARGDQGEGGSSSAPSRPRKFRRSHTVQPPPAPMTEEGKRVISPVGDR